jgi:hypothetical protein
LRQARLVAPVRLALGAAGLIAAIAVGLSAATTLAAAAVGAALTIFTLASPGGRPKPEPLRPPRSGVAPGDAWWRVLAVAMFPSTYGVALLTGIALGFSGVLAAFLAGVMLGMGAVAAAYGFTFRT